MNYSATYSRRSHLRTALLFAGIALLMLAFSYAAVPLYRMFCQITGIDGTPKRADVAPEKIYVNSVNVSFDSNVANGLPWKFTASKPVYIRIGEVAQVEYTAQNLTAGETTGTATFNVLPEAAAKYFNKMQCFCFNEQTLKAGEKINMPVVFFVDPEILKDEDVKNINSITLSYTFFPVKNVQKALNTNTQP